MFFIMYLPDNPDDQFILSNENNTAVGSFDSLKQARQELRAYKLLNPELKREYFKIFKEIR